MTPMVATTMTKIIARTILPVVIPKLWRVVDFLPFLIGFLISYYTLWRNHRPPQGVERRPTPFVVNLGWLLVQLSIYTQSFPAKSEGGEGTR